MNMQLILLYISLIHLWKAVSEREVPFRRWLFERRSLLYLHDPGVPRR
jgi:hypothetical protein